MAGRSVLTKAASRPAAVTKAECGAICCVDADVIGAARFSIVPSVVARFAGT